MSTLSNKLYSDKGEYQYTPEEAAILMRRRMFIRLKWFAILGVIIATLVASQVFHIGFPALPVYIICVAMVLYNLFLMYQVRRLREEKPGLLIQKSRTYGYINIYFDLVALTAILHFTGGITNPFIFYFVFHIIIASVVLHYRTVYLLATLALVLITLLVGLEYAEVIPHKYILNNKPLIHIYIQNITKRKEEEIKLIKAMKKANESDKSYKNLTQNIPGMVYRSTKDWSVKIITTSAALLSLRNLL